MPYFLFRYFYEIYATIVRYDSLTEFQIVRNHSMDIFLIRKIAFTWAEYAEKEYRMSCIYEEGAFEDLVHFKKSGVKGLLFLNNKKIEITVKLGLLLSPFSINIQNQIILKIDSLLLI